MKCLLLSLLLIGVCSAIKMRGIDCGSNLPSSCSSVRIPLSLHDGCNRCICAPGAKAMACTRKACPGPKSDADHDYCTRVQLENEMNVRVASSRVLCDFELSCAGVKSGVSVSDGCNNCHCAPGHDAPACTRMLCPAPKTAIARAFCNRLKSENERKIQEAS